MANVRPPAPGVGMPFDVYFQSITVEPTLGGVYFLDINASPAGCQTRWTTSSTDRGMLAFSPTTGNGRGLIEIFVEPNPGPVRSAIVTVAGLSATIVQRAR